MRRIVALSRAPDGCWPHHWAAPPRPWEDPERRLASLEAREQLREAIAALPPSASGSSSPCATSKDSTPDEVCELLEISDGNQRVLLHRGQVGVSAKRSRSTWMAEMHRHGTDEVTCREFVELVTDYWDGALPEHRLELVEEHLVMCDWCKTYLDQMGRRSRRCRRRRSPSRCPRRPRRRCSRPSASGRTGAERRPWPTSSCARARSARSATSLGPRPSGGSAGEVGRRRPSGRRSAATASTPASAATCRSGSGRSFGRSSSTARSSRAVTSCGRRADGSCAGSRPGLCKARGDFARACAARAAEHAARPRRGAELAATMAADGDARAERGRGERRSLRGGARRPRQRLHRGYDRPAGRGRERHEAERDWQVEWLARELSLGG